MYHRVILNGRMEVIETRMAVSACLRLLHPKFTPLPLLVKHVERMCKMLHMYCTVRRDMMIPDESERRKETIRQRTKLTVMLRKLNTIQRSFGNVRDRQEFLFRFYNLILELEGMGLLTGFAVMQRGSRARLKVNPEYVSLRQMEKDF